RGHVHLGGYVSDLGTTSNARGKLSDFADAGFEFVDIEAARPDLIPLARYARTKGLHVFAREAPDLGMYTPLCGLVAGMTTPAHWYRTGTEFHDALASSHELISLDVSALPTNATQLSFSVQPAGSKQESMIGPTTPSLTSAQDSDPVPGTSLAFDAVSRQRL